jgi:uncharacterized protein YfiM (DUF2279 family)
MIALDKCTHFLACYSITLTAGICSTPEEGAAAGLIAGIAKESYDCRSGGSGWDWHDMIADVAGVVAGYLVLNGMRWLKIV